MRIWIREYPLDVAFETKAKFPKFKYGCKKRTQIAVKRLSKLAFDAPHEPTDFVVAQVVKVPGGEVWLLDS